jgi:uncharacterized delta-60 repeat protein
MTILLPAADRAALRFFARSPARAMPSYDGRWIRTVAAAAIALSGPVSALAPGEDGVIHTIAVSGISDVAQAVAIDPGGNIVLVGSAGGNYSALARITPTGAADLGFGTGGGIATPDFSSSTGGDGLRAIVRTSDGGYVGCGPFNSPTTGNDFFVVRFGSSGTLDGTFNGVGYAVTPFTATASSEQCNAVAVQSDGMIVSAGYRTASGHLHVALTRHTALGQLDANFGNGGKLDIDASASLSGDSQATALLLQPDGQLLIAGYALGSGTDDFLVMRLNAADGTPDMSFGTAGITRTPIGTGEDIAYAMVLQPNGRIVLAGSTYAADGHRDFALARYTAAGLLDPDFSGGKVTTAIGPSDDYAYALILMPWGRLVAAGSARINTSSAETDLAIVAYNADGTLDRFFGNAGKRMLSISSLADSVYGLSSDIGGARFWAVGTAAAGLNPNHDFLAVEFGLPDTIFRHGFETNTAP